MKAKAGYTFHLICLSVNQIEKFDLVHFLSDAKTEEQFYSILRQGILPLLVKLMIYSIGEGGGGLTCTSEHNVADILLSDRLKVSVYDKVLPPST